MEKIWGAMWMLQASCGKCKSLLAQRFLQVMAEMKPLGLAGFLLIVIVFLRDGLNVIKNNTEQRPLRIGLFCAGCACLIHNFVDLSFYFGQVAFFLVDNRRIIF
jgi:hypothetical protein